MATRAQKKWLEPLARAGYSARGIVYGIIGLFALMAAFGDGQKKGTRGALETLLGQPFGEVLVWLTVVGLFGFVAWRLVQAIFDPDEHGTDAKGAAVRVSLMVSAITYGLLGLFALDLLGVLSRGSGSGSGGFAQTISGFVGTDVVALILSIIFFGVAIAHIYRAFAEKYEDHFKADRDTMKVIHPISKVGLIARGLVFAVISVMLFYRFLSAPASSPRPPGVEEALAFVQGLPAGMILLIVMGIGLMAFAAYSFAEATYRRINVEDATT